MKPSKMKVLWAAALAALTLAACGGQTVQAPYIGIDAAKAIAVEAAGVTEDAASFSTAGLDKQNGLEFYAVDFTANGQSYEYDIDAVTGVIIDSETPADAAAPADGTQAAGQPAGGQTDSQAAGQTAGQTEDQAAGQTADPAPSGTSGGSQTSTPAANTSAGAITEDQAREIALANAGLTSDQVTFLRSKLDYDDGRRVYDIEFYTADYTEYDYEIDADTGTILSYDFDAEGYTPPASGTTSITAEQAQQIALEKVPGATERDIYEFEVDRDDGRLEYEGTIYYDGMEYEFTIDGYSGAVRDWEAERHR